MLGLGGLGMKLDGWDDKVGLDKEERRVRQRREKKGGLDRLSINLFRY